MAVREDNAHATKRVRQSSAVAALLIVFILFGTLVVWTYFSPLQLVISGKMFVIGCTEPAISVDPSWQVTRDGRFGLINFGPDLSGKKSYVIRWGF
jgi:hypothetical protein